MLDYFVFKIRKSALRVPVLVFGLIIIYSTLCGQNRLTGEKFAGRSEVFAQNGMVCTSQPLATEAAIDILKAGGNAIDAAIAANAVLGVTEPNNCGIGGDLFAIVWDAKTKKLYGLNASGRSPYGLTLDYFKEHGYSSIPSRGPVSLSVPGCVDGWFQLHDRFGRLSMDEILSPAIGYARNGFPLPGIVAAEWARDVTKFDGSDDFKAIFMPGGKAPVKGEIFKNPGLASTLEEIARGGRDAFYEGEIAEKIVEYVQNLGVFFSKKDFEDNVSQWVEPVSTNYRGYDVWELPPNGQGIAVLQMLNILESYDIKNMGFGSPEYMHLFIEAKKLAFEDRAKYYSDPDFNTLPIAQLISKDYGKEKASLIKKNKAAKDYSSGKLKNGDTVYLTVADKEGNMVSLIQSVFVGFGSGIAPAQLGFILQNRGALFSLEEGHFNVFEPHKRPFHTIIPAFVTKEGGPYMSFGLMGGAMQPQGHVQILCNIIDFGMNLQESGDAPRIRHDGSSQPTGEKMTDGGVVNLEFGFPEESVNALKRNGHVVHVVSDGGYGGYQAIRWDAKNKVYIGASESRKDGYAAGY